MKQSTIIGVVLAILVIGGGYYLYHSMRPAAVTLGAPAATTDQNGADASTTAQSGIQVDGSVTIGDPAPMTATITYTSQGFSPTQVTIKKGGTVTWVNQSNGGMWVGSASHPTHTAYDGTTLQEHCGEPTDEAPFDQCETGDSFSFTFDKVGTWSYHNHVNASRTGSVTVVE